ncbi:hypothetical protein N9L68_04900 [bacterium]|nr:hypothetical protein [bacterium]
MHFRFGDCLLKRDRGASMAGRDLGNPWAARVHTPDRGRREGAARFRCGRSPGAAVGRIRKRSDGGGVSVRMAPTARAVIGARLWGRGSCVAPNISSAFFLA